MLKVVWRAVGPLRRALAARVDRHLDRHLQGWLDRTEQVQADQKRSSAEMQLVADALIRELVRLQRQVERLQVAVELTLVDREDVDDRIASHRRVA
jgi:hypothetical protein